MAMQAPPLGNGRAPLLMAGVLTLLLGLVTATSALVGPVPRQQETAERSRPPIRAVIPGAAASPLTTEDRLGSAPACPPEHSQASPPGTAVLASTDEDPRGYLQKMATLPYRRRMTTPTTLDPYQASLNPVVYLAGLATPTARHDGSVQAGAGFRRHCRGATGLNEIPAAPSADGPG